MKLKKLFAGVLAGAMVLGTTVMPSSAATGDITAASWQGMIAFNGFNTSWGGWYAVYTEAGSSYTLTTTVQAIMDANSITSLDEFGGFIFQIWNISSDDDIDYTLSIDGTVYETGTYDASGSGTQVNNNYAFGWGEYSFDDTSIEVSATVTVNSYSATTTYEIDEDIINTYSSYTATVESSDGKTGTVEGNTYYAVTDDDTGAVTYYIGIDVTDIPGDVTVTITDVVFE